MKNVLSLFLAFTLLLGGVALAQVKDLKETQKEKTAFLEPTKAVDVSVSKAYIKHNGAIFNGTKAIECMEGVTYSNAPVGFTGAVTSNTSAGYMAAQLVENFEYPIQSFRFFGIQAFHNGTSFVPMNDVDPYNFEISFYEDNAGLPGTLISTETASLNHVNTGVLFASVYNVYHWDYIPAAAITGLPATFWVSVVNTNTDAWFMWIDQPAGLGVAAQYATGAWALSTYNSLGICIVPVLADVAAPDAATNFTVTPGADGAMSVNVSWTNPALTFGGDPLTELTKMELFINEVSVYVNNSPVIGGDEDETIDLSLEDAGDFTFKVVGTNTAGEGISVTATAYVGEDTPAAPTNVVLTKNEMEAQLSWDAPVVGINGAYFSGTGLTYDVIRYPGEVLVADNQAGLTFTETLVTPGNYSYKVIASNAIGVGGNATSNSLLFGDFIIYEMFDGATIPTGWTTMGLGLTNWTIATTANAGGAANEVRFGFSPSFTGVSYFVSPVINASTYSSLTLNYKDMFDDYNATAKTIGVKTTIDGGATWLVVSEETMANGNVNIGPRDMEVVITNEHIGNPNFQVAFFFNGYSFNMDNWYIDNLTLTGVEAAGAYVTFTVKEGVTPLEGAVVNVNSINHTTNTEGIVVPYVLEGTDTPYTVNKFGYAEATGTLTVVDGVDQELEVQLVPLTTYEVTFNILDANLNPAEALVTLKLDGVDVASGTSTGGTVTFTGIPNGDYTYTVALQGYITASGDVTVTDANVTVPDVVLVVDPNIIIGTEAVTGKAYPVNPYFGYTYSQSIYLKSEIANMPMTITHVKYYFYGASLSNSNNWTIYMGHTTKSAFASTTDWVPVAQLTQVYSNVFTSPTGSGWIEFDITDFEYNGIDNLVIAVDENKADYNGSSDRFLCSAVTGNRSIVYYNDSTNPDPSTPPAASASEAFIPNTILTAYPKPGANVTFTVTDGVDPIEGAVIIVDAKNFTTLANGTVIAYVGEGTDIPYTVNKFGFEEYAGTITVVDGVEQDVNVTMVALATYSVTFNIKNIVNDNLNATVTAYYDGVQIDVQTAVDGVAVFTDVPIGTYTYNVDFAGYLSLLDQELVVDGDEVVDVTLTEIIEAPFALMIDVNHAEVSALFSWNNGEAYFVDSFEDGTFDAWGEFVQGTGIVGDDGGNPYWFASNVVDGNNPPQGSYVARADWGYSINTWLISPLVMVNEGAGVTFNWYSSYYWSVDPNPNAQLLIKVSTDGGDTWTPIWNWQEIGVWTNFTWYETNVPLDAYVGQAVIVAVNLIGNDNAVSQIDNVRIGTPTKFGTFATSNVPNVAENAKSAGNIKTNINKAFVGYNVYLDYSETPVNAEPLAETSYLFEGLALGAHTAGVEAVYSSGVSETITIDFEVLATYNVTFTVTDIDLTPITDAVITLGDVTNIEGDYIFEGVIVGTHNYSVAKAGFNVGGGTVTVVDQDVTENVVLTVGLNSNTFANFSAYPNPFSNQITISNPAAVSRVVVANLLGQVMLNVNTNGAAQIETGSLSSGIYLVTFQAANGERLVSKMIKK